MRLGIDASNIRDGGGITYLSELLSAAQPFMHDFTRVTVWAGAQTLARLPQRPWLQLAHVPTLDRSLPARLYWQHTKLPRLAEQHCDVLFVPGGNSRDSFRPYVTMSQNLLPFESQELFRYGASGLTAKFLLLREAQSKSFGRADGVIFLSNYARTVVSQAAGLKGDAPVIPHGISRQFYLPPRHPRSLSDCSPAYPFRLLYVSRIEPYKHQWQVVEAVAQLHQRGYPVSLDLIGPGTNAAAVRRLQAALADADPRGEFIRYREEIPYAKLATYYHRADAFIFASSCENLPNILLEAMAASLPIACAYRGPMPEVLNDAGVYFDPEKPADIANALASLIENATLRGQCSWTAYGYAKGYSWERCARETFSYLTKVAHRVRQSVAVEPALTGSFSHR